MNVNHDLIARAIAGAAVERDYEKVRHIADQALAACNALAELREETLGHLTNAEARALRERDELERIEATWQELLARFPEDPTADVDADVLQSTFKLVRDARHLRRATTNPDTRRRLDALDRSLVAQDLPTLRTT